MELVTLALFCLILIVCVVFNVSIVVALIGGFFVFNAYGLIKGYGVRELVQMMISGIKTAKNILIVFVLIGMLTALWRAGGTISMIICYAARLIGPGTLVLMAFLLNCAVSVLTGTAFGTAATMGVISMAMAASMGVNQVLVGGAVLSGAFFGDRCSPVSTSALLVSELTGTNIFDNIKKMLLTALVPFLLTCAVYLIVGLRSGGEGAASDLRALFEKELTLNAYVLLPAAVILLLSAFRVKVRIAMSVSIAAAFALCLFVQHMSLEDVLRAALLGFEARDAEVAALLNGGGISSMLRVCAIIVISSSYSGIFQKTQLLSRVKESLARLSHKITPFGACTLTAMVSAMIACNQTLAIMLTNQLMRDIEPDRSALAIDIENTAVVLSPLVPWSIASAVPLSSIGAPTASLLAACFLYLVPLSMLVSSLWRQRRPAQGS